ncbi:MAG: TNT domain-containing protein [Eubacteriales bacterium]|nr:TNT domain-containing protein [Eubacteriales bacterium]
MSEIKEIARQAATDTETAIKDRVAWFYLRQLNGTEQSLSARAGSLLTQSERTGLPEPRGEAEKAALRGPCTRMALLEAQLCDTINAYTKQFTMADPQTPETIRHRMNGRLDTFLTQTQDKLHDTLTACLRQNRTADQTADALAQTFAKAAASLSTDVETCYTKASWYKILRPCEQNGCTAFRFEVRLTDGTCGACSAQRGKTYTLGQLVEQDLLPPLHPNCCCMLLPETEQAGALPEIAESPAWYDPLLRIPSDALSMLNGFVAAQQERLGQGTVLGFLDWLTMGFVSGFAEGASNRFDTLREQPSAYNFVNWLTLGAADTVKGAVNPDEPLSLEHWLSSLGVLGLAAGIYKFAKSLPTSAPSTPEELVRAADHAESIVPPSSQLVVRDPKYLNEYGEVDWERYAPNNGFIAGTEHSNEVLQAGTMIDRYGEPLGRYAAPLGTPYKMRSLPYTENSEAYHVYRVIKPIQGVKSGISSAAFDQPGGGIQYQLPKTVLSLLGEYLEEVKE